MMMMMMVCVGGAECRAPLLATLLLTFHTVSTLKIVKEIRGSVKIFYKGCILSMLGVFVSVCVTQRAPNALKFTSRQQSCAVTVVVARVTTRSWWW